MNTAIFKNHIMQMANLQANSKVILKQGKIKTYNPVDYTCTVILLPEDIETGRMPIYSMFAGNGWGMFAGASEGDLCAVFFIEGYSNMGFVFAYGFGGSKRPIETPSKQFHIQHENGSYVQLNNDGNVYINSSNVINIGDVGTTLNKLVTEGLKTIYNNHTHPSNGSPPDLLMTDNELTENLRGN